MLKYTVWHCFFRLLNYIKIGTVLVDKTNRAEESQIIADYENINFVIKEEAAKT